MSLFDSVREEVLFLAIKSGNLEEVKRITSGIHPSCLKSSLKGVDLIAEALKEHNLEIAKFLINLDLRTFSNYSDEQTVVRLAVLHGDLETVKLLLRKKEHYLTSNKLENVSPFFSIAQRIPFDDEGSQILNYILYQKILSVESKHRDANFTLLHFAAKFGNLGLSLLLLEKKSNINAKSRDNQTPLHIAAMKGHLEIVSLLLKRKALCNVFDSSQQTPLCLAVSSGSFGTVELLLKKTPHYKLRKNINQPAFLKDDPLLIYCAVGTGNQKMVELLLLEGAIVNVYSPDTGKTPLHLAVEKEYEKIVELLLKNGADVNSVISKVPFDIHVERHSFLHASFPDGYTALHIAAEIGHERIVELLIKRRANISVDEFGQTPLYLATKNGSLPIIRNLLKSYKTKHMFIPSGENDYNPFHIAVENGHLEVVKLFLKKKVPVDPVAKNRVVPLHIASKKGFKEIVQLLLKHGGNALAVGKTPFHTPLFHAANDGNTEIVKILLESCSSIESKRLEFYPALYIAAFFGHKEIVRLLLSKGVDPNASFKNCLTPLHAAVQRGHFEIFGMLLEKGAKANLEYEIESSDKKFATPLFAAIVRTVRCNNRDQNLQIIETLLRFGADPNLKVGMPSITSEDKIVDLFTIGDYENRSLYDFHRIYNSSILEVALKGNDRRVVYLLLKYGADPNVKLENELHQTILNVAVQEGDLKMISILLQRGAIVNNANDKLSFPNSPRSALQLAISKNCISTRKMMKILIEYGADVNAVNNIDGSTPLIQAMNRGNKDLVVYLLTKGARLESENVKGVPILDSFHFSPKNPQLIEFLFRCGVSGSVKGGNSFLRRVLGCIHCFNPTYNYEEEKRSNSLFNLCLNHGCNPNPKLDDDLVPSEPSLLHVAIHDCKASAVDMMLSHGVDINILGKKGRTALKLTLEKLFSILRKIPDPRRGRIVEIVYTLNDLIYGFDYHEDYTYNRISMEDIGTPTPLIIIAQSLVKMIAKLQVSGQEVHEENLKLVNSEFVIPFYKRCQAEIEMLKNCEIFRNVTYFRILVSNEAKLASYARNPEFVKGSKILEVSMKFGIYREDLLNNIQKGGERRKLVDENIGFFEKALEFKVPACITCEIFSYLRMVDLRNLTKIRKMVLFSIVEENFDTSSEDEFESLSDEESSSPSQEDNEDAEHLRAGE